ncbi:hypothetical protein Tco_0916945, partial [Tanacetum coccineum]
MQREFQSRITAVEQYVNQYKTSSTANDSPVDNIFNDTRDFNHDTLVESDVDNQNVNNHSMDFDHDLKPSCGSDNHVKTSVESYVDNQNMDNHSMDFDHDPKVVEQQNFSRNNLFDEFEHHVSSNNLINDE